MNQISRHLALAVCFVSLMSCETQRTSESSMAEGTYFTANRTPVYIGPSGNSNITNNLDAGSRIDVLETKGSWARISRYYDGRVEGVRGTVARWVRISDLSLQKPPPRPQPSIRPDQRIQGIPQVGQGGLTERDVLILYAAAGYYLDTGQAERIEFGDKSVNKDGVYYLNFGEMRNHFFRPDDIPDLESRIDRLQH